jgi:L-asparagine transporter-like permease
MWRYISKPEKKLSENLSQPMARFFSSRALAVPCIFIIFCFVYFYAPRVAFWLPPLIPLILRILFNPMKKKAFEETAFLKSSADNDITDQ